MQSSSLHSEEKTGSSRMTNSKSARRVFNRLTKLESFCRSLKKREKPVHQQGIVEKERAEGKKKISINFSGGIPKKGETVGSQTPKK